MTTLGKYIRQKRREQRLSMSTVSDLTGIELCHYSRIEGDRDFSTPEELQSIAQVLGVDLATLEALAMTTEIGKPLKGPVFECYRKPAPPRLRAGKQMNFWEN